MFTYLSIHLSIYLPGYLSLSVCLSIYLSVCLSVHYLPVSISATCLALARVVRCMSVCRWKGAGAASTKLNDALATGVCRY